MATEFEPDGCDGCEGCGSMPQAIPPAGPYKQTQTVEERLETTNLLLGHVVGRLENVAEAVQISVREAEVRHDDWQETINRGSEAMAKNQKFSARLGLILVVFVTSIVSVLVNLIM